MNIVKIEKVELSENEDKAFSLVLKVCDGILAESRNPALREMSEDVAFALRNLYLAIKDN